MSRLNYLEKLLDGTDVEWKSLGDVVDLQRGRRLVRSQLENSGKYAVYQNSMTPLGYYHECNVAAKSSFIICAGAAGEIGYSEDEFWAADDVYFAITPENINGRFLYHFLLTKKNKISGQVRRASIPRLSKSVIEKLEFPIPCPDNPEKSLAIQSEIVRILDAFTALSAELSAELSLRKKQYNYYYDQLLSFEEGQVELKPLEEVASFRRGSFPQPYGNSEWYDGDGCMPFVQVADVDDFGYRLHKNTKQQISKLAQQKSVFVEAGTVVVSLQGTIGRVALTQYDCYVDRTLAIFTKYKVAINKKYFAYQLKAKFDLEKEFARGSTLKTITKEEFSRFQIPIPPIEEQNRIVSLLDKFDTLTYSIEEGLPREIELRQKQYEYYRDLLFSFPRPDVAEA
ncbi:restriction endonuclease subunit S [Klebsiella pneumoniae]|uniref:restriction endonuclease subunit S n=1 Tax=Klebsiella pneumoniae TaxID=573 RepID=UPI003527C333|nr:restriction endonuclease subunit S [Klebsiella pneumoniae]HBR1722755.1 restriction endonuclease subunit S [Klebsiella quasipneumoniae subsp. quasipneumoniae]